MDVGQHRFRPVVAPSVPDAVRARLASSPADQSPTPILLGVGLSVLLGIAGLVLLLTGAHPLDADPAVFVAVLGGGLMAVALIALGATIRSIAAHRSARMLHARWGDQVISAEELARASTAPKVGPLLDTALRTIDDIRQSTPYREGWLEASCDESLLRGTEWAVAVAARHARIGALTKQVDRLVRLRASVRRFAEQRANGPLTGPAPAGRAEGAEVAAAVDDLIRFVRPPDIRR
jgi:hypothetical protein